MEYDEFFQEEYFEIGDQVRFVGKRERVPTGSLGTVRVVNKNQIGVEWDTFIGGHNLDGLCRMGYGRWVLDWELELVNNPNIEIEIPEVDAEMDNYIQSLRW